MQTDFFGASTKVLTVAELTRAIRGTLETRFGAVWVQGEISNYKQRSSRLFVIPSEVEESLANPLHRSEMSRLRST